MKAKKVENRIATRRFARELSVEEMKKLAGGTYTYNPHTDTEDAHSQ